MGRRVKLRPCLQDGKAVVLPLTGYMRDMDTYFSFSYIYATTYL
jgi:hypothetical protein